jgi:hypothetical protein
MRVRSLVSTIFIVALMAAVLFIGAGTIHFWQAWLYLALALTCHIAIVIDLARRDPELLERRRRGGAQVEPRPIQKLAIWLLLLVWMALPVTAGWDRRHGWSHMPIWLNLLGAAIFLAGQALMLWVAAIQQLCARHGRGQRGAGTERQGALRAGPPSHVYVIRDAGARCCLAARLVVGIDSSYTQRRCGRPAPAR